MSNQIIVVYKKNNVQIHKEALSMSLEAIKNTLDIIKREGCKSTVYTPNFEGQIWDSVDVKQINSFGKTLFEQENWVTSDNFVGVRNSDGVTVKELQDYVEEYRVVNCYEDEPVEKRMNYLFKRVDGLAQAIAQEDKTDVSEKMFDVLWNMLDIANKVGIDVNEVCKKRMENKYE
ncbi:MazG-like family protein [Bacillus cereus]|nr:MazG-like family protein [Bacillus cereus]